MQSGERGMHGCLFRFCFEGSVTELRINCRVRLSPGSCSSCSRTATSYLFVFSKVRTRFSSEWPDSFCWLIRTLKITMASSKGRRSVTSSSSPASHISINGISFFLFSLSCYGAFAQDGCNDLGRSWALPKSQFLSSNKISSFFL